MVITADSLLRENYTKSTFVPSTVTENVCFFEQMNLALIDMKRELAESKMTMYKSVLESEDIVAVNESFSGFMDTVKKIIKKFIDMIKKIFSQFVTLLHKIVKSDKYILKHKKALKAYGGDSENLVKMNIYRFTKIDKDSNIPVIDVESLTSWYGRDDTVFDPFGFNVSSETEGFYNKVKARYDFFSSKNDTSSYDGYRALVIGKSGSISISDYGSELFEVFRNGESSPSEEEIGADYVNEALYRFENYSKTIHDVEHKKKEIEHKYDEIQDAMKNWSDAATGDTSKSTAVDLFFGKDKAEKDTLKGEYDALTSEEKSKTDALVKTFAQAMITRIETYSTIHGQAFAAKLDAIKDCMTQDKKVLYAVLSKMSKTPGGLNAVKEACEGCNESIEEVPEYIDSLSGAGFFDKDILSPDMNFEERSGCK